MEKQIFITQEERKKCQKICDVFKEMYESEDTIIFDAGRYGFVKLQYYSIYTGFDCITTYTDSIKLFDSLWNDWLYTNFLAQIKNYEMENMKYDEIIKKLPQEKKLELTNKKNYFLKKCDIQL